MKMLVSLDVDDLEKAVRFYSSAFGLTQVRRFGASGVEIPQGASFKDMIALKGKSDIGDRINTQIIQPLIEANDRLARSDHEIDALEDVSTAVVGVQVPDLECVAPADHRPGSDAAHVRTDFPR